MVFYVEVIKIVLRKNLLPPMPLILGTTLVNKKQFKGGMWLLLHHFQSLYSTFGAYLSPLIGLNGSVNCSADEKYVFKKSRLVLVCYLGVVGGLCVYCVWLGDAVLCTYKSKVPRGLPYIFEDIFSIRAGLFFKALHSPRHRV